jgi:NDP-sugar pyrophosphorylase family protein
MDSPVGILLAAGLGTRLFPLTLVRPKPLVPLHGIPLMEFGLRQLEAAGCRVAGVNGHHLSPMLEAWLQHRQKVRPGLELQFFHEPRLLGVGGGLARMVRELPPGPLLVQNGDVVHDGDLAAFFAAAQVEDEGLCLALGGRPLVVECHAGRVAGLRDGARSTHGFTGVHAWSRAARERLSAWTEADLVPFLQEEIRQGRSVRGQALWAGRDDGLWVDLGHLDRYFALHMDLWAEPSYHHLLKRLELEARWDDARHVALGKDSRLPATARRCVAWDHVSWEGQCEDCLLLDGFQGRGVAQGEIML